VKFIRHIFALAAAGLLACGCDQQPPPPPAAPQAEREPTAAQPRLPTIKLWLGSAEITAEIASKPREIQIGMMFRTNVVEDEGMLFVFRQPGRVSFWMKNCPNPLSCAYIDPQGVILELHEMEPHNTNSIVASSDNVLFVLETARGWFERHDVRPGMLIQTERGPLAQTFFGNQKR
jgi:uncharacterized membrane protein (UPF0127 family)